MQAALEPKLVQTDIFHLFLLFNSNIILNPCVTHQICYRILVIILFGMRVIVIVFLNVKQLLLLHLLQIRLFHSGYEPRSQNRIVEMCADFT